MNYYCPTCDEFSVSVEELLPDFLVARCHGKELIIRPSQFLSNRFYSEQVQDAITDNFSLGPKPKPFRGTRFPRKSIRKLLNHASGRIKNSL